MTTYVVKRILLFIPTLVAITLITFTISHLAPGDPTELKVGVSMESMKADEKSQLNQQAKEYYKQKWGLDKPIYMQYLIWLANMATLDFGNSFVDNRPVMTKIVERFNHTYELKFINHCLYGSHRYIPAARQYSFWDRFSFILFVLYSLPRSVATIIDSWQT
jgi:ABC-type dipeptide/oligopeptide/nickel transport system permease component